MIPLFRDRIDRYDDRFGRYWSRDVTAAEAAAIMSGFRSAMVKTSYAAGGTALLGSLPTGGRYLAGLLGPKSPTVVVAEDGSDLNLFYKGYDLHVASADGQWFMALGEGDAGGIDDPPGFFDTLLEGLSEGGRR